MMAPRACAVALWCLAIVSPMLAAESGPAFPHVGSRVRVRSPTPTAEALVGTLTAADQMAITVAPADGRAARVFARVDVSRLERSVRQSRKKKGAIVGLGVGFAVGLAGTFILCESFGDSCPTNEGFLYGTIYGAAVGGLGAGLGAVVAPGEKWEDVPSSLVHSGDERQEPPPGVRWAIVPLLGHRRGVTIVVSF